MEWVSELLNLTAFLGTADSEVHIVHISHVIIAYTLESLSSLILRTHSLQATINFMKNDIKNETPKSIKLTRHYSNPVYGVATICHQIRWVRWGHPSLFHTATSLLIWYKMFCVRDISYRLIWMEFINMFSVYAQSGTHSHFNWWIIVFLTYNPSVLFLAEMCRNMGICYGFRSVAAGVKYPGFM